MWVIYDDWCFRCGVLVILLFFVWLFAITISRVWLWAFRISRVTHSVCIGLVTDWPPCSICSTIGCHNNRYMILLSANWGADKQWGLFTLMFTREWYGLRNSLSKQEKKMVVPFKIEYNWMPSRKFCSQTKWCDNVPHTTDFLFIVWSKWIVICMHSATQRWRTFFGIYIYISKPNVGVQRKQEHNRKNINTLKMKYLLQFGEALVEFSFSESCYFQYRRLLPKQS